MSRTQIALLIATGVYIGYAPIAPGTVGSVEGLFWVWIAERAGALAVLPHPGVSGVLVYVAVTVACGVAGTLAAGEAERHFHAIDPGPVVIDEIFGMLITMFLIPLSWRTAVLGFLLFRVSDIVKPFPASRFERWHGGVGVMADDAMAAVYANLALRAILWIWPAAGVR